MNRQDSAQTPMFEFVIGAATVSLQEKRMGVQKLSHVLSTYENFSRETISTRCTIIYTYSNV